MGPQFGAPMGDHFPEPLLPLMAQLGALHPHVAAHHLPRQQQDVTGGVVPAGAEQQSRDHKAARDRGVTRAKGAHIQQKKEGEKQKKRGCSLRCFIFKSNTESPPQMQNMILSAFL